LQRTIEAIGGSHQLLGQRKPMLVMPLHGPYTPPQIINQNGGQVQRMPIPCITTMQLLGIIHHAS